MVEIPFTLLFHPPNIKSIGKVCLCCTFEIYPIQSLLPIPSSFPLVQVPIVSCLDYCSRLLATLPLSVIPFTVILLKHQSDAVIPLKLSNDLLFSDWIKSKALTVAHEAKHDLALLVLISLAARYFANSSSVTLTSLSFLHHAQGLCTCCSLCEEHSSPKPLHGLLSYIVSDSAQMSQLKRPTPDHPVRTFAALPVCILFPASSFFIALTYWIALYLSIFCLFSSTEMWVSWEQMYCYVHCYMVRNIHNMNDLFECGN